MKLLVRNCLTEVPNPYQRITSQLSAMGKCGFMGVCLFEKLILHFALEDFPPQQDR